MNILILFLNNPIYGILESKELGIEKRKVDLFCLITPFLDQCH